MPTVSRVPIENFRSPDARSSDAWIRAEEMPDDTKSARAAWIAGECFSNMPRRLCLHRTPRTHPARGCNRSDRLVFDAFSHQLEESNLPRCPLALGAHLTECCAGGFRTGDRRFVGQRKRKRRQTGRHYADTSLAAPIFTQYLMALPWLMPRERAHSE